MKNTPLTQGSPPLGPGYKVDMHRGSQAFEPKSNSKSLKRNLAPQLKLPFRSNTTLSHNRALRQLSPPRENVDYERDELRQVVRAAFSDQLRHKVDGGRPGTVHVLDDVCGESEHICESYLDSHWIWATAEPKARRATQT
jgi:hypothetical protein